MNEEELIRLYNNIQAKDPTIIGQSLGEFLPTVSNRVDLDAFLGGIEQYHPDIFEKYQSNKTQGAPSLIQEDPLQSQMRQNLAPVKTTKQSREEILNTVYPVDTSIASQEKQRRQEEINQRREADKQYRTDLIFSGNLIEQVAGLSLSVGTLFDQSAAEDRNSALNTLKEDTSIRTEDLTPDLVRNFTDSKAAEQARKDSELFKSNRELLEQGKGLGTDIWTNLPAKRIHELQTVDGMTLDQIMSAKDIAGYTQQQLLDMKEIIGAEQVKNAKEEYEKLDAFDNVLAGREERVPQYIKDDVARLQELLPLGEQLTPEQKQEVISIQKSLTADPNYKEYVDIFKRQSYSQEARANIKDKFPEVEFIKTLNDEIQAKKDEEYSNNIWMKRAAGAIFSGPVLAYNTLATLPSYLTSTLDAELASRGNEAAQLRLGLRAQELNRGGVFRDAQVASRPINEKLAEFADDKGNKYTMAFTEDGKRALDIYDENGNPANIPDASKLQWLQWGEQSGLKTTAKNKWNSDAIVNTVQDLTTDIAGTMAMMYATRKLGEGPIVDRVRTSLSIYGQYMGRFAEEGVKQGLSPKDAVNRARLLAAIEAGTESMFNIFGKVIDPLKLKGSKDAIARVLAEGNPEQIRRITTQEFRKTLLEGALGEPSEEVVAEYATPFANALFNDTAGTDFDQNMPSGLDIATAAGLGFIGSVGPTLAAASRVSSDVRSDQFYKESIYSLVKDPSKTQQAIDFVGQGTELLPVIQATANKARVDLADKSLTEQQKIDRVSAIFNSEIAKQRQTELAGTPREGEADGLVDATDTELKDAYTVQTSAQEGTDSTVTGRNVNPVRDVDSLRTGFTEAGSLSRETQDASHLGTWIRGNANVGDVIENENGNYEVTSINKNGDVVLTPFEVTENGTRDYNHSGLIELTEANPKRASGLFEQAYTNGEGNRVVAQSTYVPFAPIVQPTPRPITATPKTVQGYADIIKATIPQLEPQQVQDLATIAQTQVDTLVREAGIPEEEAWARVKGKITTDYNRLQGEVLKQSPISISQQYNEGEIDENELLQNIRSQENLPTEVQELAPVLERALSRGDNMSAAAIGQEIADILAANETSAPISVFPTPELEQQFKNQLDETIRTQQIRRGTGSQDTTDSGRRQEASDILRGSHATARSLGLTNPREIEEIALREWAVANGLWVEDLEAEHGDRFLKSGLESRVYFSEDGTEVIKGNDGKAYASWAAAMFNFEQTGVYFPSEALTILGFGNVTDVSGKKVFGAILGQPLVRNPKSPTRQQIIADMKKRGFKPLSAGSFVHKETGLEVDDLHTRNVLIDENGDMRYIDVNIHDPNSSLYTDGYLPLETAVQENEAFTLREQEETVNIELPSGREVTGITNPEVVNGFYSPLEEIINESKQDKMPVKQWIEKYANSDEAKWTGLRDWLEQQKGSISKADIQQYLKDNRIKVVEVVKAEDQLEVIPLSKITWEKPEEGSDLAEDFEYVSSDGQYRVAKYSDGSMVLFNSDDESISLINSLTEDIEVDKDNSDTKFSQQQLEGAKRDYKEILVTLPSSNEDMGIPADWGAYYRDGLWEIEDASGRVVAVDGNRRTAEEKAQPSVPTNKRTKKDDFHSSHFGEPNILVHLRMNTRTDVDGNKVLFLEEVQSDWGQKGRKEGFKLSPAQQKESDRLETEYKKAERETSKYWDANANNLSVGRLAEVDPVFKEIFNKEQKAWDDFQTSLRGTTRNSVPQAPFVTDSNAWTKLGLKVALKEAVAQGADKIAWTTGEQQNERYDLSKQVDYITKHEENSVNKEDNSVDVTISVNNGLMGVVVDKTTGRIKRQNGSSQFGDFVGKGLGEVIGKDLTDKILKLDNTEHKLQGDGLKVGGKGMVGFYGSPTENSLGIVGKVAKNLFKQEPKTTILSSGIWVEEDGRTLLNDADGDTWGSYYRGTNGMINATDMYGKDVQVGTVSEAKDHIEKAATFSKTTQHSIDITPKLKAEVEDGLPLFQKDTEGNTRGAATRTGTYFSNQADVSTPIHEDHHHFLDIIDELAAEGNEWALEQKAAIDEFAASEEGRKFWKRKKEAGVEWARGRFNRNNYTFRQELFTESAEKYFSEGEKAGFSDKINKVFERFKVWLQDLYKNLLDSPLVIELSPKMRGLFDSIYGPAKVTKDINQHNRKADSNTGVNDYVWAPVMVDNGQGVPPAPQAPDRAKVLERLREKKAAGEYTDAEKVLNGNPEGYDTLGMGLQELGQVLNEGREMLPLANGMSVPDAPVDDSDIEQILLNEFIEFNFVVSETEKKLSELAVVQDNELPKELYMREVANYNETANALANLVSKTFDTLGQERANAFFLRELRGRKIPLATQRMLITLFTNRPGIMRPEFRTLLKIMETEIGSEAGRALGVAGWMRRALGGDDTITPQDRKLARSLLNFDDNAKLNEAEATLGNEAEMAADATDAVLLEMDSPTPLKIVIDSDISDTGNVDTNSLILENSKAILQTAMKKKYGDDYIAAMVNIINETGKKCQ